jgi:hypothetical protein
MTGSGGPWGRRPSAGGPWSDRRADAPQPSLPPASPQERAADIQNALRNDLVPAAIRERLAGARAGRLPWTATLTPAELLVARTHGLKPIAAVSATCWLHYGWSWTEGHAQGWEAALRRLRAEAKAAGANAVLDVKMRTLPLAVENSMDFSLIGTAVHVEGLPASPDPIVATVPALEFVKLLEADVVATGIAIGAQYEWLTDWRTSALQMWGVNTEYLALSQFWELIRQRAHAELRRSAQSQGNGVLAHINFGQMFEIEGDPKRFLGRQIVIATTVDTPRGKRFPHDIRLVVDMCAGSTPLTGRRRHHQSYDVGDEGGAI